MNQFTGVNSTFLESDATPKTCAMSSCERSKPSKLLAHLKGWAEFLPARNG
jgi:hypothetical protein